MRPLIFVVALETAILALLFLLLLLWRPLERLTEARRRRRRERLREALRLHGEEGRDAELVRLLGRVPLRVIVEMPAADPGEKEGEGATEDGEKQGDVRPDPSGPPSWAVLAREAGVHDRIAREASSRLWWRRQRAARLLGRLGDHRDAPVLASLVEDRDPVVATSALVAARRVRWPELLEPLLERTLAASTEPHLRPRMLESALAAYGMAVLPRLEERLRASSDERESLELVRLAGLIGDASLRVPLEERLRRGSLEIRVNAARALGRCGGRKSVPALLGALEDPAWQVRTQAAKALARLGATEAGEALATALSDPNWWVRLRSAVALRRLGPEGTARLRATDPEHDRFAFQMARYVLGLDEAALEEHAG